MTEPYTLDLGEFGDLTVLERIEPHTGIVRFHISGRRAAGVFVFTPYADRDEALPRRVSIAYGDDHWLPIRRTNRPQFNGVELEGGAILDPDVIGDLRHRLDLRRVGRGWHQSSQYPQRSADYATAAIEALVERWRTHPQRDNLVLAAARLTADYRIDELLNYQIRPRWARVAELTAQIDRTYAVVEQLRAIS